MRQRKNPGHRDLGSRGIERSRLGFGWSLLGSLLGWSLLGGSRSWSLLNRSLLGLAVLGRHSRVVIHQSLATGCGDAVAGWSSVLLRCDRVNVTQGHQAGHQLGVVDLALG